ncbi:MAG: aldo/keto reductase [Thermoguttaceae bacterium]|jgi:predicted aldo/keto reductase-like oxidoreductase|nr:aldo/keto reductase [Thermoguttaceae bacterium]
MSMLSRREFLLRSSAAVAAASLAPRPAFGDAAATAASATVRTGVDTVTLGGTGIETSVLGLGTGTFGGREQRELGQEGFSRLVRQAFERGVRYIDTADSYRIHSMVAEAIKGLPREKLFIQTKMRANTAEDVRANIERFRRELGIETLDTCLIHCMTQKGWPAERRPVIDSLLEAKEKGRIRAAGVSCHSLEALIDAVDCDEIDVLLVRVNHAGSHMDAAPEQVVPHVRRMYESGRGVLGMKIYGEGRFKTRQERLDSLKYVLSLGCVPAFTIGFKDIGQIEETFSLIEEAGRLQKKAA